MDMPSSGKFSRPRVTDIVPRDRLFGQLDHMRRRPVIWISAPGGAGKSTLLSNYLEIRNPSHLWYQLDERDGDIATFYYHLGAAVRKAAPRFRKPLPALTPEYLQSIGTFTRRWFEEMFRRLKTPAVVVFDNFQDVPAERGFHEMMLHGLDVIPEGTNVVVLSRNDCPPAFSRLVAAGKIEQLGWGEIQFTREEAATFLHHQGHDGYSDDEVALLHEKTEGWVAGLVLVMARIGNRRLSPNELAGLGSGAVFDYFASEIFERAASPMRDFLLKTAFLDKISPADAAELSGNPDAEEILERLHREHYFTHKHLQLPPVYQYHALFREFLLTRARRTLPAVDIERLQYRAGLLLERAGAVEEAAVLFAESMAWEPLTKLILSQAEALLAHGRSETLGAWLALLPVEYLAAEPWLQFWKGMSLLASDPHAARVELEQAFEKFRTANILAGALLSWSMIIESIMYEWSHFELLDHFVGRVDLLLPSESVGFPSPELEARVSAAMFIALSWRQPKHPQLPYWEDKVFRIMLSTQQPLLKVMLANHLLIHHLWNGEFAKTAVIIDAVRPLSRQHDNAPLIQLTWWVMEAMQSWFAGDHWTCLSAITEGNRLAASSGVHLLDVYLNAQGVYSGVSLGDPETASACLRIMAEANPTRDLDRSLFHYMASAVAWKEGDLHSAVKHGEIAVELAATTRSTLAQALCEIELATVLFDIGRPDEATHYLERARRNSGGRNFMEFICHLHAARFAFERGDSSIGEAELRAAMSLGAQQGYVNIPRWNDRVMSDMGARALEAGIESDYVRRLLDTHRLPSAVATRHDERHASRQDILHQARHRLGEETQRLHRETLQKEAKIRELESDRERMQTLVITDPLTGLYNRRHFDQVFPQEYQRAQKNDRTFMFVMIDVDNFKRYNDIYGHSAGDDVLRTVATALRTALHRTGDMVFRLGGEEFGVIGSCRPTETGALSEVLCQAVFDLAIPHQGNRPHGRVTISAGACLGTGAGGMNEIYDQADEALYQAKQNGRNGYVLTTR